MLFKSLQFRILFNITIMGNFYKDSCNFPIKYLLYAKQDRFHINILKASLFIKLVLAVFKIPIPPLAQQVYEKNMTFTRNIVRIIIQNKKVIRWKTWRIKSNKK